jgi:hypothetical protein
MIYESSKLPKSLGVDVFRKGDTVTQKHSGLTFTVNGILLRRFDLYLYLDGKTEPVKAEDYLITRRA